MTKDEIIRMAREAGLYVGENLSGVALVGHAKHNGLLIHTDVDDIERLVQAAYAAGAAAEREACADKTGEFARKWWSIHCASNKHMETTRKAHDDFCALQAAIRARGNT